MKNKLPLLILIILLACVGLWLYFSHRNNPVAEKMEALYGMRIALPLDQMMRVPADSSTVTADRQEAHVVHKMVVFYDSVSCSACAYRQLFHWNELIGEVNQNQQRVCFLFIMHPSQRDKEALFQAVQNTNGLSEPQWIDTLGIFVKANAFLPRERLYHCLLLDDDNKVVFVGNPLANQRLKELFLKTIQN